MKKWPLKYKALKGQNIFSYKDYLLTPIRFEDRYKIMRWRNEQIFHLRQQTELTEKEQDDYFLKVIAKQFNQETPDQILFSLIKENQCVAYGGLVHIDWSNKIAEVSFVINTLLDKKYFRSLWSLFLKILMQISFKELNLHKTFTCAFDLRPKLFEVLEKSGYKKEGCLKDHHRINGEFCDVILHSCINPIHDLELREVNENDSEILFNWRNDLKVRRNAFDSNKIDMSSHNKWLRNKISDKKCKLYIFETKLAHPIGQVRFDKINHEWVITYSIDKYFRGLGLGQIILKKSIEKIKKGSFNAIVKKENIASIKSFINLGFRKTARKDNSIKFTLVR